MLQVVDVVEINDPDELESYRLAWNALLPETRRASFFHTFDWFQLYWRHFGQGQKMRVLVVRTGGIPIGIVPLCVCRERYHVGSIRVLNYPLSDWGMWYGPIGPNQSASLFLALRHLRSTERDWDMIDLRWIADESNRQNTTGRALRFAGWRPQRSTYQQSSVIRLDGTDWESYRANLPKKWRHEIGRQDRALCRSIHVEFERYRPDGAASGDDDPRWDLYEQCLHVSRQSWQGSSTSGNTLCHEDVSAFLRECHASAAKLGMLDLAVLRVDGRAAAFQYNYLFGGQLFGLRMGFDPQFSRQGVGKVIMSRMIQDSFNRHDKTIDMGIGDFQFKRRFRTDVETNNRYTCYSWLAWRSQGVRLTRWLKESGRGRAKVIVAKTPRA